MPPPTVMTETDVVNGGSITTFYDAAGRPEKTVNGDGAVLSETVYDSGGRMQTVDAMGCVTENVYNSLWQIGSTTMVTDITGKIVEQFAYGPYGELLTAVKNKIKFLYNGSYGVTTDENGLYYMHTRYYNPDIKRFINQDIKVGDIGSSQSLNRYAYCEGNPVSLVDPFGLSPESTQDQAKESKYEKLHNLLGTIGIFFDGADIINEGLYALEGDWGNAALCAVVFIPAVGSVIVGAVKGAKAVIKAKKQRRYYHLQKNRGTLSGK